MMLMLLMMFDDDDDGDDDDGNKYKKSKIDKFIFEKFPHVQATAIISNECLDWSISVKMLLHQQTRDERDASNNTPRLLVLAKLPRSCTTTIEKAEVDYHNNTK